ncbi:MAG: hypothetical protein JWN49_352 [Parcubacteria group bacterium]|nr:hypothetical protein [Parcubacteria group bacterium]
MRTIPILVLGLAALVSACSLEPDLVVAEYVAPTGSTFRLVEYPNHALYLSAVGLDETSDDGKPSTPNQRALSVLQTELARLTCPHRLMPLGESGYRLSVDGNPPATLSVNPIPDKDGSRMRLLVLSRVTHRITILSGKGTILPTCRCGHQR